MTPVNFAEALAPLEPQLAAGAIWRCAFCRGLNMRESARCAECNSVQVKGQGD